MSVRRISLNLNPPPLLLNNVIHQMIKQMHSMFIVRYKTIWALLNAGTHCTVSIIVMGRGLMHKYSTVSRTALPQNYFWLKWCRAPFLNKDTPQSERQ